MKNQIMSRKILIMLAALLLLAFSLPATAQTPPGQSQSEPSPLPGQAAPVADPFGQLGLTPDQVQKIRTINMELKDERQVANRNLRLAQRELTLAIESPTPDEKLIDQRSREFADAQSATIRLRSLTEARVLQVLTPEQRLKLREIRQQNQAARRANQQQQNNRPNQRQGALPRNANGAQPLGPNQRRLLQKTLPRKRF
jgi:Spy/CpxP family protein refolding chaperone